MDQPELDLDTATPTPEFLTDAELADKLERLTTGLVSLEYTAGALKRKAAELRDRLAVPAP